MSAWCMGRLRRMTREQLEDLAIGRGTEDQCEVEGAQRLLAERGSDGGEGRHDTEEGK